MERKMHTIPNYAYNGVSSWATPSPGVAPAASSPLRRNIDMVQLSKRTKITSRPLSSERQLALELFIYLTEFSRGEADEIAHTLKSIFPSLTSDDWEQLSSIDENRSQRVKNIYDAEDDVEEEDLWTRITSLPDEGLFSRMQNLVERIENEGCSTNLSLGVSIQDEEWMVLRGDGKAPLPIRIKKYDGPEIIPSYDIPLNDPTVLAAQQAAVDQFNAAAKAAKKAYNDKREFEMSQMTQQLISGYINVYPKDKTPAAGIDWPIMDYHDHNLTTSPSSAAGSMDDSPIPDVVDIDSYLPPQTSDEEASQIEHAIAESLRAFQPMPMSMPIPKPQSSLTPIHGNTSPTNPIPASVRKQSQSQSQSQPPRLFARMPKLLVHDPEPLPIPRGQKRKELCTIYEDPENEPDVGEDGDLDMEATRLAEQQRKKRSEMEIYRAEKEKENWEESEREVEEREAEELEMAIKMSLE